MEKIEKIHIETFIRYLEFLYSSGLDFIDLDGVSQIDGSNFLNITYKDEYINPNYASNFSLDDTFPIDMKDFNGDSDDIVI